MIPISNFGVSTVLIRVVGTALAAWILAAGAAEAASFTVDIPSDAATPDLCSDAAADCTIRGAIEKANALAGEDSIVLDSSIAQIPIDSPLPAVTEKLMIDGRGVAIIGTGLYAASCGAEDRAVPALAPLARIALPVYAVCGRSANSPTAPPTISVGPRRADGSVRIAGAAESGSVEIYRAGPPAEQGEALSPLVSTAVDGGYYSVVPAVEPAAGEKFVATVTGADAWTSDFSLQAEAPSDLSSPSLLGAFATSNNSVRLDFDEPISPAVSARGGAFALTMGGLAREVSFVDVQGRSVYLTSLTMPWRTGEAGSVGFTGQARVADVAGNELLGLPSRKVYAGPGELVLPVVSALKVSPSSFCRAKTPRCTKAARTYVRFSLNKPSRVQFTILRAKGRRFVARFVRVYPAGKIRSLMRGEVNGRGLPATNLIVEVVAEDVARTRSAPVGAPFKVVTRN